MYIKIKRLPDLAYTFNPSYNTLYYRRRFIRTAQTDKHLQDHIREKIELPSVNEISRQFL
jgi:hypothetical protein